ncbi:uncharacterized protein LOC6725408 [Drosophila simulans]|uniref:GD16135 n=1 Tax=Drosophila simulans TaxID=7240 RepID=B4R699_DROSI|nr:uncharacterized protein LOC6725408 [Drosophila simulans]EDX17376.1 GD16135 [Drosophila simulans]KMZ08695.1 uncharacterized protein Dsimw501_GD16135 [Drosophila simulans]
MFPINAVILAIVVISVLTQDASGTCKLNIGVPAPLVITNFGSQRILSDFLTTYEGEKGQTIRLSCASGFSMDYVYNYGGHSSQTVDATELTVTCDSDQRFTFIYNDRKNSIISVRCLEDGPQLFESMTKLPNCTGMTLVLGKKFDGKGLIKDSALCYDLAASQLKYIGYTTSFHNIRIVSEHQLGQLNHIGLDIPIRYQKYLFETIRKSELAAYLAKDFQIGSLVQDELVSRHLVGYEDLMSTVWLEVLRSGNWKHWTKAMHDAIGVHFDIRLGVSGSVKLPTSTGQSCNASRSLNIELLSGKSLPIPAHIWAHVQAVEKTGTGQDEFVIIGHNSPFYRSDLSNLCPSMCNQVSWLRNTLFARLHEFPAFGMVQCCRVEDVAHKLDNFPGPFENANMNVSRTTEATTTPTVDLAYENDEHI